MSELGPLQEAMLRVLFHDEPSGTDLATLAPDAGKERARVLLYRELARHRLCDVVRLAFPRTIAALPRASDRLDAWLAAEVPRSRFFRDVPLAFGPWLVSDLVRADATSAAPPYTADLARLEAARWRAMIEVEDDARVVPFDLEKVPAPSATLTVLCPTWSVHLEGDPEPGRYFVSVYRRPDHVVETRWTERVPGLLLEAWARGTSSAIDSVRSVLAAEGRSADHAFVERMSELLATLLERGALRGSRPEG